MSRAVCILSHSGSVFKEGEVCYIELIEGIQYRFTSEDCKISISLYVSRVLGDDVYIVVPCGGNVVFKVCDDIPHQEKERMILMLRGII